MRTADVTLDSLRWQRLKEAFAAAVAEPEERRSKIVQELAVDDPALAALLRELLKAHGRSGAPFEPSHATWVVDAARLLDASAIGEQVGPYKLVALLGRGGMGVVYRGRRIDGQFDGEVAIKLLPHDRFDDEARRRFRIERDVVAGLRHPGIARLHDAGETLQGLPYCVMELIDGEPITEWCRRRQVDLRGRIAVFKKVCEAVQHAHERMVLHRDVKPDNILVDADGQPKLIDFGIAKSLRSGAGADETTKTRNRVFSLTNASPEQLQGKSLGVGCDIYQLGTVIHELLSGEPVHHWVGRSLGEVESEILQRDPRAVSERARGAEAAWRRLLRGDLDALVAKCLRRDPADRYTSVASLIDDLDAWSAGRPLKARRGQRGYVARKIMRRHAVAIAIAVLGLGALVTFSSVLYVQADSLAAQRDAAIREAAQADELTAFLLDIFKSAEPGFSLPSDYPVSAVVDQAQQRLQNSSAIEPQVRARLMDSLAAVNLAMERFDVARGLLAESRAVFEPTGHSDPRRAMEHFLLDAEASDGDGDQVAAESSAMRALAIHASALPDRAAFIRAQRVLNGIEHARRGREVALEKGRALLAAAAADSTVSAREIARLELDLVQLQEVGGDGSAALALVDSAVARLSAALGADHPETLLARMRRGDVLDYLLGRPDEALALYAEVLPKIQARLGASSRSEARLLIFMANAHSTRNEHEKSLGLLQQASAILDQRFPKPHLDQMAVRMSIGFALDGLGRHREAADSFTAALSIVKAVVGPEAPNAIVARAAIGRSAFRAGQLNRAEEALLVNLPLVGGTGRKASQTLYWLARVKQAKGQPAEARKLVSVAIAGLKADASDSSNADRATLTNLLAELAPSEP